MRARRYAVGAILGATALMVSVVPASAGPLSGSAAFLGPAGSGARTGTARDVSGVRTTDTEMTAGPDAVAAMADLPTDPVTIPARARQEPRRLTSAPMAGATGLLYSTEQDNGSTRLTWTGAGGATVDFGPYQAVSGAVATAGGIDSVAWPYRSPSTGRVERVDFLDVSTAAVTGAVAIPDGYTYRTTFGPTVVVFKGNPADNDILLLRLVDGAVVSTPVGAGLNTTNFGRWVSDGTVILGARADGFAYVDLATGAWTAAAPLIPGLSGASTVLGLTADHLLGYGNLQYWVRPRSGGDWTLLGASSTMGAPATLAATNGYLYTLRINTLPATLLATPLTGGTPVALLDRVRDARRLGDGSVMVTGSTGSVAEVYRITQPAGAPPAVTTVYSHPPVRAITVGVALTGRRLVTVDDSASGFGAVETDLGLTGPLTPGVPTTLGAPVPMPGCPSGPCLRMLTAGGFTARTYGSTQTGIVVTGPSGVIRTIPSIYPDLPMALRQFSGQLLSYLAYQTDTHDTVIDVSSGQTVRVPIGSAYALWGSMIWTPAGDVATTGRFTGRDPVTGQERTVATAARCVPNTVRVTARYLAWTCGDTAGVRNLGTGTDVSIPAGELGLGDGFVVTRVGYDLVATDLTTSPPASRLIATLPGNGSTQAPQPVLDLNASWAVDSYGGQVLALVDSEWGLRIVPLGVATSPVAVSGARVPATYGGTTAWQPSWSFTKPATWVLTIRDGAGSVVYRASSSAAGLVAAIRWNGRTPDPRTTTATYAWSLVVTPVDGAGAALTVTGSATGSLVSPLPPTSRYDRVLA